MQAFAVIIVIRGTRIMANFAGVQLHGTMRRMACMTMMMAAIVTGLCACTEKTEITTDMNGSGATDNDNFQIRMTKSVPAQYFSEATEQGQVVRIEYDSRDYTCDNHPATRKPAYVYLPYGYDESRSYDVIYLMHGWTCRAEDTFETLGGVQKNILDWMIQQGDCRP